MARGNNGNLLQHATECELAVRLADPNLTLLLGHGMRPFEPFPEKRSSHRLLDRALETATGARSEEDLSSAVQRAYRRSSASDRHYPNSLELLEELLSTTSLRGAVAEVVEEIASELDHRWNGTGVRVFHGSWRTLFGEFQPPALGPWLLSLDPCTYCPESSAEDANLHRSDWSILEGTVSRLQDTGRGGLLVFCYELKKQRQRLPGAGTYEAFLQDGREFADKTQMALEAVQIQASGGNRHVGLVLTTEEVLSREVARNFEELKDSLE